MADNSISAQGTWIQKADFGGAGRTHAVGFSIGNKGYIGTGLGASERKDFWEYDPAINTWVQKSDFGGTARWGATGFSIGNSGYMGTGLDDSDYTPDIWKYDPASDSWTLNSTMNTVKGFGAGFNIGQKGYIGTGYRYTFIWLKEFSEFDASINTWTSKADFGGTNRQSAVGFSIGSKGYIGTGVQDAGYSLPYKDFWEYDPSTNAWTQKADFGGPARMNAVGFSIGNKGYIGTGQNGSTKYKDFWEYDPVTNTWVQKSDFGGTERYGAVGFSIGNKGYIGTGSGAKKDFWEYDPNGITCLPPTNLSSTSITPSSEKVEWDVVADAKRYKLRYKITGSNTWTTITNISSSSKTISGLASSSSYTFQVKSVCSANPVVASEWSSSHTFTTASLRIGDASLQQASISIYPNPAEDHATIQFTLPYSSQVYIKVYDVTGQEIERLLNAQMQQGEHSLQLNTTQFSKGVYMVRMISDAGIENQKLIVQ